MPATIFAITSTGTRLQLADGAGTVPFAVHNRTSRFVRGRAKVVPEDPAAADWLKIDGPEERDFPEGATHSFIVVANVPATAEPGRYRFRLDAFSVDNPDDLYVEGPTVEFEVTAREPVAHNGGVPWWTWAVAALVLVAVLGGVAIALFGRGGVPAPPLVGMTVEEARNELERTLDADSVLLVAVDETVNRLDQNRRVVGQDPDSGQKITASDTIRVRVGVARAPMPDLRTLQLGPAAARLLEAGFALDRVTFVGQMVSGGGAQTVTGQTPAAHDTVPLDTAVRVRYRIPTGGGGGPVVTGPAILMDTAVLNAIARLQQQGVPAVGVQHITPQVVLDTSGFRP
jgi:hypothetical protein